MVRNHYLHAALVAVYATLVVALLAIFVDGVDMIVMLPVIAGIFLITLTLLSPVGEKTKDLVERTGLYFGIVSILFPIFATVNMVAKDYDAVNVCWAILIGCIAVTFIICAIGFIVKLHSYINKRFPAPPEKKDETSK